MLGWAGSPKGRPLVLRSDAVFESFLCPEHVAGLASQGQAFGEGPAAVAELSQAGRARRGGHSSLL